MLRLTPRIPLRTATRRISHAIEPPPARLDVSALDTPRVCVSTSHDPWFNLSYEEWLFRNTPATTPILFFYRNTPSVVIGRNQNPWKETTPAVLVDQGIPLIRRRSGGGAVFHDLGNINFSFLIPRALFSRSLGADIIVHALRDGMHFRNARVNDRGDLVLLDSEGVQRKIGSPQRWLVQWALIPFLFRAPYISGSAYKIVSQRAYHHGTMLVSSDLDNLGRYLRSKTPHIETRGVDSVRSPVINLSTFQPHTTHQEFIHHVAQSFVHAFTTGDLSPRAFGRVFAAEPGGTVDVERVDEARVLGAGDGRANKIRSGMEELKTWDWVYGQTPEFSISLTGNLPFGDITMEVTSKHGVITHCKSSTTNEDEELRASLSELDRRLVGQRYDAIELDMGKGRVTDQVVSWLRQSI